MTPFTTLFHDEGGDILLLYYYVGGIGVGSLILCLLSLFPGTTMPSKSKNDSHHLRQTVGEKEVVATKKQKEREEKKQESSNNDNTLPKWAGDELPNETLENLRKKFDLTPEQMKTVMETSRNQYISQTYNDDGVDSSWTPHQILNTIVYVIMFSVLIFVVNRDYGNIISIWFVTHFPKEADVLGIVITAAG